MSEISDLMGKDPLHVTLTDVTQIVAHYRDHRELYVQGQKAPRESVAKVKVPKGSVDLSTLEIKI